jgi:hypothetical protein
MMGLRQQILPARGFEPYVVLCYLVSFHELLQKLCLSKVLKAPRNHFLVKPLPMQEVGLNGAQIP